MSTKGFLIVPVALLAFAAQSPETLTPVGPATLYSDWHGGMTLEGEHPELLTGFRVVVQPGGRAGTIRFLVHERPLNGDEGTRAVHVGRPVTLPAEPGTYTFPAPHVFADYRSVTYGIEQETGGHAITAQIRCSPAEGEDADPPVMVGAVAWTAWGRSRSTSGPTSCARGATSASAGSSLRSPPSRTATRSP